ncbi:MAG: hypothetical protein AAGC55_12150, partial [Myxococcota bacterium]
MNSQTDDSQMDDSVSDSASGRGSAVLAVAELIVLLTVSVLPLPVPVLIPLLAVAALSLWLRGLGFADAGLAADQRTGIAFAAGLVGGAIAVAVAAWLLGPAVQAVIGRPVDFNVLPPLRGNSELLVQAMILAWAGAAAAELVFRGYLLHRLTT